MGQVIILGGAVKNNYVQFANKCWGIVRITGNGAIKLILHNTNKAETDDPCSSANNSPAAAFARDNNVLITTKFNENNNDKNLDKSSKIVFPLKRFSTCSNTIFSNKLIPFHTHSFAFLY